MKINMKIKTQDLTGIQLDWAVAKCLNWKDYNEDGVPYIELDSSHMSRRFGPYKPSTDWEHAGPIIDWQNIHWGFGTKDGNKVVIASKLGHHVKPLLGPTPLIAAMRCYVDSILGNKIEIPEELIET